MKFIHLSDLHLGKRPDGFSLQEDQQYILDRILEIAAEEKPDAVFIAGDVYDKALPPAEAVELLDDFLVRLTRLGGKTFVISGNHDSPERLAFGSRLMQEGGLYIAPVYDGNVEPVPVRDAWGEVLVYMLPFVKPAAVRHRFPDENIETWTDAVRTAVAHMPAGDGARQIILSHQFITGAERSDSEIVPVGGLDNVDASAYDGFDYVALGHLHRPQMIGSSGRIRYAGTPLKYSFSEVNDRKSVTVGEMDGTGAVSLREIPLVPLRDLKEIRGRYDDLMRKSFYEGTSYQTDYMRIILTDEEDVPEAAAKLRLVYHNLAKLDYDNKRTRHEGTPEALAGGKELSPLEMFEALYEQQNGTPFSEEQKAFAESLIRSVWEEEA
nr:exonuclease SbcCD subunit D [Lachnospiraceae bacterium]